MVLKYYCLGVVIVAKKIVMTYLLLLFVFLLPLLLLLLLMLILLLFLFLINHANCLQSATGCNLKVIFRKEVKSRSNRKSKIGRGGLAAFGGVGGVLAAARSQSG